VGGIDQPLARTPGARERAHHVPGDHRLGLDREVGREAHSGELDGPEGAALGLGFERLEVEPGGLYQIGGRVALDPGFEGRVDRGRVLADHVEDGDRVGVLHGGRQLYT
jgi:hypothetical protein